MSVSINQPGVDILAPVADAYADILTPSAVGFLADLQVWGSPDQVIEKILTNVDKCNAGGLIIQTRFGGMDADVANRNYRLFVDKVLPALKAYDVGGDLGVLHAPPQAAKRAG